MIMVHTLLNNESPEVIRYFRHLEYLTTLWEKDREKYRPVLNGERYLTEAELSGLLKVTRLAPVSTTETSEAKPLIKY